MLSKNLLKSYKCDTIYDYFNIVIESKINGNNQQAKEQFKKIEKSKRMDFLCHCKNLTSEDQIIEFFEHIMFI